MDNEKEISFGAFDSELMHQEISIPEGFEATIEGNKIILKKIESEDENLIKEIISIVKSYRECCITEGNHRFDDCISWLEKQEQEPRKVSIWKHWKDGICGNGEGKLIYLIKNGDDYRLSSCLGFECDYIELSELEKQGTSYTKRDVDDAFVEGMAFAKDELEKQGEQKPVVIIPKFRVGDEVITKNEESLTITRIDEEGYWSEDLFICGFDDSDKWELVEPAEWSEEDMSKVQRICKYLNEAKKYYADITEVRECMDWLKYLPQKQRKPTKEQMDALLFVVQHYTPKVTDKLAWDSIKILELMYYEIK